MTFSVFLTFILLTACGATGDVRDVEINESGAHKALELQLASCINSDCDKVVFADPVGSGELKSCALDAIAKANVRSRSIQYYSTLGRKVPTITYDTSGEACRDFFVVVYFDGDEKGFDKAIVDIAFF